MHVALDSGETLTVISTESLVLDRISRATDRTGVTFDEAVRLCRAVKETAHWALVERRVDTEDRLAPLLRLKETYERVLAKAG